MMIEPQLNIRPAQPSDGQGLSRLLVQLGYAVEPKRIERMIYVADSDLETIVIAEIEGQPVGLISVIYFDYFPTAERYARVTALVVDDDSRNQGIGSELLAYARQSAAEQGCTCLEVTSAESREVACQFYEDAGFQRTGFKFIMPVMKTD
ncbi:GNAT family N-acetyltransferase [Photobacterium sp. 53610]|uniref:GNAT family N-acetyltransferase n=1 Tax=Photobacterium sp. 53610 TaxID=3102789 RepID=UPI002ED8D897